MWNKEKYCSCMLIVFTLMVDLEGNILLRAPKWIIEPDQTRYYEFEVKSRPLLCTYTPQQYVMIS